ncbi:MAG: sodium:calcium antiporter, partial [Duncaniella sp.]|nr:sodium:calcium antiporter [Duncaniella sp.]
IIGLTIVAAGTSLPELATSITAALKGKTGIALGNVIGSNIFNIFMVLGVTATVSPLRFGDIGNLDLLVLTGASLLFWIFGWFFRQRTITRAEGALLTLGYIAYVTVLISRAS